jgi:phosphatidyl-myo-inositol dimannoside synthase
LGTHGRAHIGRGSLQPPPLKVLALLTDGFGAVGGIAQYNRDLMTALSRSEEVEEVIALPRFGTSPAEASLNVTQVASAPSRTAWGQRAIALAVRQRPDVIFCGHLRAAPLAAALAQVTLRPLWIQAHGVEAWDRPNSLVRRATERAKLVTCVSRYTRRRLLAWSNIAPERLRVLPNTIASSHAPRARRQDLIDRHDLVGRKVILTVGRLSARERYKGHDRVIASLPQVAAHYPESLYLIVGDGDDRLRLEELANGEGVSERVIFAGKVAADLLPDYYALADVFAMPSTGEGFGIVFLEAAASGLPVIGGNRDGSLDALADGRIGRAVDPGDVKALALAIIDALGRRRHQDSTALQRFAFENFASHVDQLVRTLGG